MRFDGFQRALRRAASTAASDALRTYVHSGGGLASRLRASAERVVELRALDAGVRDALWLVDGLGFSVREAAEMTGSDPEAMERRLAEGRRSVSKGLGHAV